MSHLSAKLAPKRYGPFTVTKAIFHTSYQLQLPFMWKIHPTFHTSHLTPYKETREHGNNFMEPPPDLINRQPEREVEKVLGSQQWHNQLQYLIRWKGFSEAHDSWEPLTHINAKHLVEDFHRKNPAAIRGVNTHKRKPLPFTLRPPPLRRIMTSTPDS